ncbi:MAG: hypothetical protein IPJ65_12900 [Archangiaceae bacterium]|nr:hypothetical protein [Archangiaceae bacterium]
MSDEDAERESRINELEARLAQPARLGVAPIVAAAFLALCCILLWAQWADAAYFFSPREPLQLGAEGDYRFDLARDNRYVELHGVPTSRAGFGVDGNDTVVAVGIRDTPIMVWRKALRGEEWKPGTRPPPPNQQPFTVRGRLLARGEAGEKFASAFQTLDGHGEISAQWVLVESARPGVDLFVAAWSTLLMALAAFSAWLLVRGLLAMKQRITRAP